MCFFSALAELATANYCESFIKQTCRCSCKTGQVPPHGLSFSQIRKIVSRHFPCFYVLNGATSDLMTQMNSHLLLLTAKTSLVENLEEPLCKKPPKKTALQIPHLYCNSRVPELYEVYEVNQLLLLKLNVPMLSKLCVNTPKTKAGLQQPAGKK